jgi:hypothetical protein
MRHACCTRAGWIAVRLVTGGCRSSFRSTDRQLRQPLYLLSQGSSAQEGARYRLAGEVPRARQGDSRDWCELLGQLGGGGPAVRESEHGESRCPGRWEHRCLIAGAGVDGTFHCLSRLGDLEGVGGHPIGDGGYDETVSPVIGRTRFLAVLGAIIGLHSALVILAQWIPNLVLSPCYGIA